MSGPGKAGTSAWPDDVLIRRAQRGDIAALDDVARRILPHVRRWARTHVSGSDDADDVAQLALISALRGLAGFDFRARLDTWLYRIVRRCAADHYRARRRRTTLAERIASGTAPDAGSTAAEPDVDADRLGALLGDCFRKLPARQRDVFDLVELQGMSAAEAALVLDLAPATVRVHLMRARRMLRQRIMDLDPALAEDRNGLLERA